MVPQIRTPPDVRAERVPKALLFCPDCGHESPVDGDWVLWTRTNGGDRTVYACPVCGTVIQSRPQFDDCTETALRP
jgi:predicted RNA-binding Zn-ribbon protein involved in translation (DUF1610 family)